MDDDDADAEKEDDEEEEEERHQSSGIRGEGLDGQVGFCCKIEQIYNDRWMAFRSITLLDRSLIFGPIVFHPFC